ncbi:unnamed protein product [Citrullus colocynthis]|uniref:Uncharacterized protein n=1 Tax=Citrullus colocynthis TaxID=252529 RepID=A0ABP0Z9E7_9ROSI
MSGNVLCPKIPDSENVNQPIQVVPKSIKKTHEDNFEVVAESIDFDDVSKEDVSKEDSSGSKLLENEFDLFDNPDEFESEILNTKGKKKISETNSCPPKIVDDEKSNSNDDWEEKDVGLFDNENDSISKEDWPSDNL